MLSSPFLPTNFHLTPPKTCPHTQPRVQPCRTRRHVSFQVLSTSEFQKSQMSDRGQAPSDWLASFKKAQCAEQHRARPPSWVASRHITSQYPVNSFELNMEQNHSSTTAPAHIPPPICTHAFGFFFYSHFFSLSAPLSKFSVGNYTKPPKVCIYIKNQTMPLFKKYIDNKGGEGKHAQPPPSKLD